MTYAISYGSFGTGILKIREREFSKFGKREFPRLWERKGNKTNPCPKYGHGNHKYHNHKHQKDSQPPPQSSDSLTYLGEGVAKQDEVSYEVSKGKMGNRCDITEDDGLYWALLGCTELQLSCSGLYGAVLGCTVMYLAVLEWTRLDWTLWLLEHLRC